MQFKTKYSISYLGAPMWWDLPNSGDVSEIHEVDFRHVLDLMHGLGIHWKGYDDMFSSEFNDPEMALLTLHATDISQARGTVPDSKI